MGKPRMIILIRHAQSEGNKNRDIHQLIPDHRVKLTDEGRKQAEEAGRRLRDMLHPDDTIQFFTSPYRRTRETTEGILSSLTADTPEQGPSPFPRHTIKVFEEPRLREQDFGNFQPCSTEMERMWQERADYGHFFYRIPNGESAADAYDRVSGFNESMWRNFNEEDFPSVCVLVTHGLMTRVFLMKWYHWSVEYFEDLRNVNHCEFVIMKKSEDNGKYILQNQLRTWSELKRPASSANLLKSPTIPPTRKWGGCVRGCNHQHANFPRRLKTLKQDDTLLPPAASEAPPQQGHPIVSQGLSTSSTSSPSSATKPLTSNTALPVRPSFPQGRDGGGSLSGMATSTEDFSGTESDYFARVRQTQKLHNQHHRRPSDANPNNRNAVNGTRNPQRKPTVQDYENWARQSGMGSGARAERLGDEELEQEGDEDVDQEGDEDVEQEGDGDEDGDDEREEADEERDDEQRGDLGDTPSDVMEELKRREIEDKSLRGSVY